MIATTTATTAPARTRGEASVLASTLVITKRSLLKWLRTPQLVVLGTIQGAIFLLIYRYVFGGAIGVAGVPYVDYLIPGFLASMVLFVGMGSATGVATDMAEGFVSRLRSLPIPRSSMLTARALSDTAQAVWALAFTTAVGFAVGFRFHGTPLAALAALGLCVVFAFAFEWMFVAFGAMAGNAQAAQGIGFLVFPLTFFSSTYVPVSTMPSWLQWFAQWQPVTQMVDAVRALTLGPRAQALMPHSAGWYVVVSLLWAAAFVAVFAPLAVRKFRAG
jgi:ABC transporter DrrB family efflux protein